MSRRGRSKLSGGFETGGAGTIPIVPALRDYVTVSGMGQEEPEFTQAELDIIAAAQEHANKTGQPVEITAIMITDPASGVTKPMVVYPKKTVMKKVFIGAAILAALYFSAKAAGVLGD